VTNLSFYEELINTETRSLNKSSKTDIECKISMDLVLIKLTLSEIMPKRQKREIIEIGTLRKWIAMVKMNKNNNKQFTISSKLFNEVKFPTDNLKNVVFNEETILRKHRLRLLRFKLRNLLDTIFLTKPKIFNTKILNEKQF